MSMLDPPSRRFPDISSLLRQLPVYVALWDRDARLVWSNRWAYGHDAGDAGASYADLIAPADHVTWLRAFRFARDEGRHVPGRCSGVPADGGPAVPWSYRMAPHRVGASVIGVIVCCWVDEADPPPDLARFLLSPLSRQIVQLLARGPAKGVVIGKHVGMLSGDRRQASSKLRAALSGLEDRGILRNGPDGYEVTAEFRAVSRLVSPDPLD